MTKNLILILTIILTSSRISAQLSPDNYVLLDDENALSKINFQNPLSNTVTDIITIGDTIWLGTNTGLCKYDLAGNKWRYLDHLPFKGSIIKCLYLQKDTLWIGTTGNLYSFDIRTEKIIKIIFKK